MLTLGVCICVCMRAFIHDTDTHIEIYSVL